ncbi:MAG: hypothetical protein ACI90V_011077, partial [Bacillariaceae sp.]
NPQQADNSEIIVTYDKRPTIISIMNIVLY